VAPSITVAQDGSILLALFTSIGAGGTFTAPTGMTLLASDTDGTSPSWAVYYQEGVGWRYGHQNIDREQLDGWRPYFTFAGLDMDEQLPSKLVIDARFTELARQRDEALGRLVIAAGDIAALQARIQELEAQTLKAE
jgi:hypothetical protein